MKENNQNHSEYMTYSTAEFFELFDTWTKKYVFLIFSIVTKPPNERRSYINILENDKYLHDAPDSFNPNELVYLDNEVIGRILVAILLTDEYRYDIAGYNPVLPQKYIEKLRDQYDIGFIRDTIF